MKGRVAGSVPRLVAGPEGAGPVGESRVEPTGSDPLPKRSGPRSSRYDARTRPDPAPLTGRTRTPPRSPDIPAAQGSRPPRHPRQVPGAPARAAAASSRTGPDTERPEQQGQSPRTTGPRWPAHGPRRMSDHAQPRPRMRPHHRPLKPAPATAQANTPPLHMRQGDAQPDTAPNPHPHARGDGADQAGGGWSSRERGAFSASGVTTGQLP